MKTKVAISILTVLAAATMTIGAQDWPDEYLGLPGDNLNLYAVMNLFQESETLEGFERSLNDENSRINNLDLNGDNMTDYITVSDYVDRNVHTIVLRAQLSRNEQQDVAVFTVEKLRNGSVQIQLIGDEALYGRNYIIEPIYAETPNPGYTGSATYRSNVNVVTTTYYDIAAWPLIRFIYRPHYVVWRSGWYWGYYPTYWHPWRPYYWHYYYGYHYHWHPHYYSHYRHWNHYRCHNYKTFYYSKVRTYSPTVVVNVNKGHYRNTYSRPDQRKAGEELYARTHDPRNMQSRTTGSAQRTVNNTYEKQNRNLEARSTTSVNRSRENASAPAVRSSSQSRSTSTPAVQRSSPSRSTNTSAVQRSSPSRSTSTPAVQRSSPSRSTSTPAVQRSSASKSSTPAVQRSTSNRSSSPAVQRSTSTRSSTPAVQRSTSNRSSTPAVKKSSNSNRSSSDHKSSGSKSSASSRSARR